MTEITAEVLADQIARLVDENRRLTAERSQWASGIEREVERLKADQKLWREQRDEWMKKEIESFKTFAFRYAFLRQHIVRVRKLNLMAKGATLDQLLDEAMRRVPPPTVHGAVVAALRPH